MAALTRGDTATALAEFSRAYGVLPYGGNDDVAPRIALELARLERARGQPVAADSRLAMGTFATQLTPVRAEMEELRAQIAEQRGDPATAIRNWRNFIGLWQDADPELQPRVAAARTALSRLEGR
jgi:hypothetical protein